MAGLQQRGNKWRAKVRVPTALAAEYGASHLYKTLTAPDRRGARLEAEGWELLLKAEWAARMQREKPAANVLRTLYEALRQEAARGAFALHTGDPEADPFVEGVGHEIDKLADETGGRELDPVEEVRLKALQDAAEELQGRPAGPRPELEPSFIELAASYVDLWAAQSGLKPSNTRQQKEATYRLFGDFIGDRPIRTVRQADAAAFVDALRRMDPVWARSPGARELGWVELQRRFGGARVGMADATVNRHVQALQALWQWAARRGHCSGSNPFEGHRRRLRPGVNVRGYLPWETEELAKLLSPPPRRSDLTEVILVGMFTGMRLDEIASLKWSQFREAEGVRFIQVEDAKTQAGNRQVPLHPALGWLWERRGKPLARVWPTFNPEGPGKKAGADAGREFSRFKASRGFPDRRKVFHSLRKNVTQQMERAGVPENEWAQVFGHERGFTYSRYSPHGITLERKAAIIGLIAYPDVPLGPALAQPG